MSDLLNRPAQADIAPRALSALTAALKAISADLDENWQTVHNVAELIAVEDAIAELDEVLGNLTAALDRASVEG